jgi:NADPH-dependent FMN reductase
MTKLKIAIIVSTTRAARFGHKPAQWVQDIAAQRGDIDAEIVDLRDFPMPFFDEVASNAWVPSQDPIAQRWQKEGGGVRRLHLRDRRIQSRRAGRAEERPRLRLSRMEQKGRRFCRLRFGRRLARSSTCA